MNPFEQTVEFLDREEELALAIAWRERGDIKARDKILLAHRPMIVTMAKRYDRRFAVPIDDLEQEGFLALQLVLDRFDPALGLRFSTLARWWLMAAMQAFVMQNYSAVRYPNSNGVRDRFFKGDRAKSVSLDAPRGRDDEGETLGDRLVDPNRLPDENVEAIIDGERLTAFIEAALRRLKPRSRKVIRKRLLQEEPATLDELGTELGISKERVRQIQAKALKDIARVFEKMDATAP